MHEMWSVDSQKNYYKSSVVAEMGDRLAKIGMGRKWRGAAGARGPNWVPM